MNKVIGVESEGELLNSLKMGVRTSVIKHCNEDGWMVWTRNDGECVIRKEINTSTAIFQSTARTMNKR